MTTRTAWRALPRPRALITSWGFGVLSQGAQVALLATSAWLITRAAEQPPILYLTLAIVAVRAFAISRAVFRYLERLSSHNAAFRALAELRVWIYQRLVPLAPAGLRKTGRGGVLSAIVRDVDTLQDLPLRVVQPVASALTVVLISLGVFFVLDFRAGLVLVVLLSISAAVSIWLSARLSSQADTLLAPLRAELADNLIETLQRRDVLQAFGAEQDYRRTADELDRRVQWAERRIAWSQGLTGALAIGFGGLSVFAVAHLVAPRVDSGELSGPLFALLVLTPLAVFEVFQTVPQAVASWRGVVAAEARIDQLVPAEIPAGIPQEIAPVSLEDSEPRRGEVRCRRLELSQFQAAWPDSGLSPFQPVSVSLEVGQTIVVSGPSGVGKSTLASALAGFIDYQGRCRIDGVELRDQPLLWRRKRLVVIEQSPHLFHTSIRHNLSFARPGASDEELRTVLERVGLGAWLSERGGLDADVGERGALVSGGQAQRIALARGLLSHAPILVLDEPTAHVDRQVADQLIADILGTIARDSERMALVISHLPVEPHLVTQTISVVAAPAPTNSAETGLAGPEGSSPPRGRKSSS